MKTYKINTVQDMIDCTNENNIDNFLKDLKGVLLSAHLVNHISGQKGKSEGFEWIDDGKNNINIKLESK